MIMPPFALFQSSTLWEKKYKRATSRKANIAAMAHTLVTTVATFKLKVSLIASISKFLPEFRPWHLRGSSFGPDTLGCFEMIRIVAASTIGKKEKSK